MGAAAREERRGTGEGGRRTSAEMATSQRQPSVGRMSQPRRASKHAPSVKRQHIATMLLACAVAGPLSTSIVVETGRKPPTPTPKRMRDAISPPKPGDAADVKPKTSDVSSAPPYAGRRP